MKANTRIPYFSTVQLEDGPAVPPYTLRGEKEWLPWAQAYTDALDEQTLKANTRIPYASTLQLDAEDGPAWPVRGEKEWLPWAQITTDALDEMTRKANTRIPYASEVQLEDSNLVHITTKEGDELIKQI